MQPKGLHSQYKKKHPKPKGFGKYIETAAYIAGILGPIMTIPQAWKIFAEKSAEGVSLISWGSYILFAFVWLAYGIHHKEKPLIITMLLWIIIEIVIVTGIIIY